MAFQTKGSEWLTNTLGDMFSSFSDSYSDTSKSGSFGYRKNPKAADNSQEDRIRAYLEEANRQPDQELSIDPYEGLFSGQKGSLRPFSFELPSVQPQGLVDPRYAPDTSNMPSPVAEAVKRKIQTQGSSMPEAVAEKFGGFRSPTGSMKMPTPEYAPEEKPTEDKGPGFGSKLSGILGGIAPLINDEIERQKDINSSTKNDTTELGIRMQRAGLIDDFRDIAIKPTSYREEYKQGLFKDAFKNAVNERGDFDESKLVKNLSNAGFGKEAYTIWNKNMSESKRLGLELMKLDARKKTPGVQLTQEAYVELKKKFPNAKIELDASGAVKKITDDPLATERARQGQIAKNIQAENQYYQTGQRVNTGQPNIGAGGMVPPVSRGQIQQVPQVGGPSRGPTALGITGQPMEALPQGGVGASPQGPVIQYEGSPKEIQQQRIAERKRAQNVLDKAGGNDIRGIQDSLENIRGITDMVGNVKLNQSESDVYLDPKVKTGRALKYLPDALQNKELQTAMSYMNRTLFQEKARMVKGMSRIADSERESAMFEKGMPLLENSNQTNQNILKTMESQFQNYLNYVSEKQTYINQHGTDQGFDDRWQQYKENNPRVMRTKNGLMVESGVLVPYKEYNEQSQQGAQPIPYDLNSMKDNFKDPRTLNPLLQDKGLANRIKEDQMYIHQGGMMSGKDIKAFIKKHGGGK